MSRILVILVIVGLLGGCGSTGARIGSTAIRYVGQNSDDLSRLGGQTGPLSDEAVSTIARNGDVDPAMVRQVAPELGSQGVWSRVSPRLNEIAASPGGQVAMSVGCDVASGEITTWEQFADALFKAGVDLGTPQGRALADSTYEVGNTLVEAMRTGNESDKAAVAVFCYTVSTAVSLDS